MAAINTENEHLLEHKWVLWFRPPASTGGASQAQVWENSQKLMFTATTVEDFWRGFNNIPRITPAHPINSDYSLFKDGIKPMWEDKFNKSGGRWTYTIERRNQGAGNVSNLIETAWLDVMLCLIGEGFEGYGDQIAGGVCGIRRGGNKDAGGMGAKIHIWTKEASDVDTNMGIGQILKAVLHCPDGQLCYTPHEKNRQGSLKI